MLVARGNIERRQAIINIGLQSFIPKIDSVQPYSKPPKILVQKYRALIDTGAQRTCLSRKVIAQEKLHRLGKRAIQNIHGIETHYLFIINIGVFCERLENSTDNECEQTYYSLPDPVEVIDIADNDWFDAILGMDVIEKMAFRIERDRSFSVILG